MAIDFPNAPTVGQVFTSGAQTWVWDGVAWVVTDSPVPNATNYVLRAGDVMTGQLQVPSLLVNVDASVAGKLMLAGDPTDPLQATTKAYVDAYGTGRYLPLTGGTLTGNLTVQNSAPIVNFVENDQALDLKRWRLVLTNTAFYIQPRTDADVGLTGAMTFYRDTLGMTDVRITGAPLTAPTADSLMTMARSDARYLQLTGGILTGNLTIQNNAPIIIMIENDRALDLKRWRLVLNNSALDFQPRTDADGALLGGMTLYRNNLGLTDVRITGAPLSGATVDSLMTRGRGDERYPRYLDNWVAGTYSQWSIVGHNGGTWIATKSTAQEPGPAAADWDTLGGAGGAFTGATPPPSPAAGQLWYSTVDPVGLYVWYTDADSSQWVATASGISQPVANTLYLQLVGGTMTGPLNLSHLTPALTFIETDAGADLGRWRIRVSGGSMVLNTLLDSGGYGSGGLTLSRDTTGVADMTLSVIAANGSILPVSSSVVTRARGDARYLLLSGGTLTAGISIQNATPHVTLIESDAAVDAQRWRLTAYSGRFTIEPRTNADATGTGYFALYRTAAGITDARLVGAAATPPDPDSILTVARGDVRYLPIATRAAFVTRNLAQQGLGLADGQSVIAAGLTYIRLAGASTIPDLLGFTFGSPMTVAHFGALADGTTDCFQAFKAAVLNGAALVPKGTWRVTVPVGDSLAPETACGLYADGPDASVQVFGAGDVFMRVTKTRPIFRGLTVSRQSGSTVQKLLSVDTDIGNEWFAITNCRINSFPYGIYSPGGVTTDGCEFTVTDCRFNQVDYPIYLANGGINHVFTRNYMLGCLTGITGIAKGLPDAAGKPLEGMLVTDNVILPNRTNGKGVHISGSTSVGILDNMIDQIGPGGIGILLDGSVNSISPFVTRNRWIGGGAEGAVGVQILGDVTNGQVLDTIIVGFAWNIRVEVSGTKHPARILISPGIMRGDTDNPAFTSDMYLNGGRVMSYGVFDSQSPVGLVEIDTDVFIDRGARYTGTTQKNQDTAPLTREIIRIGRTKTNSAPAIASGFMISASVARVFVPFFREAQNTVVGIRFSDIAHFSIRHGGGTATLSNIAFNGATGTGMGLDVTLSAPLTVGAPVILQINGAVPGAFLGVV